MNKRLPLWQPCLMICLVLIWSGTRLQADDEPTTQAPQTEEKQSEEAPTDETQPEGRKAVQLEKVTVVIEGEDVLQQEGIHEWAGKASKLVVEYYPIFDKLLESDGYIPPKEVTITFRKMEGVAYSTGNGIFISADWIRSQPGDFGMVAHELVHIIQSYPRRTGPGWVTEGIADYMRHAHYEPDAPMRRVNPDQAKYTDAYQITAGFFIWIEKTYDKEFAKKLNAAMRERTYSDNLFEQYTGKKLDDLWAEYVVVLRERQDQNRNRSQQSTRENLTYEVLIPHAIALYKATNGYSPKTHEEFMKEIIQSNNIKLPELKDGYRYEYNPEKAELEVVYPIGIQ